MRLRSTTIVWIAATALLGIVGQWYGGPLADLWRLLFGVLIVAILIEYLTVQATSLTAQLVQQETAYLGRETQWQLQIHNQTQRRIKARFAPMSPVRFSGPLPEGFEDIPSASHRHLDFRQTPQQLGEHTWPTQPVELTGIFHLASWVKHLPLESKQQTQAMTLVEPDQLQPAARRAALDRQGPQTASKMNLGGQEFRSIRAYTSGDSPASIDWKSTARSGQLRVRETYEEQQLLIYFALDCGVTSGLQNGNMTCLSHAANLIARMSEFANQAGDRFGLLTFADQPMAQLRPGRGTTHLRSLRDILTQVETIPVESNPLSSVLAVSKMLPQRALVLLFTSLDDVEAAGQLAQATLLLRPQHLPMLISVEDPWVRGTASGDLLEQQDIFVTIAADEQRRSAAATRAQVERLGAIVVEATPNEIESMVFDRLRQLRANHSV